MIGEDDKTQPQELLEDVIGITHGDRNEDEKFPTLQEQADHWKQKDHEQEMSEDISYFPCDCGRSFPTKEGLRMHIARVHTKTIQVKGEGQPKPKRKRKPKPKPEPQVELVNHPMYDYPPKPGQIQPWDKIKPRPAETLFTDRKKWSRARRRRYNAKKREQQKMDMLSVSTGPLPSPWIEEPQQEEPVPMIKFCPHCGKGIERFLS